MCPMPSFLSCLTLRLDKPKGNCGRCLTIAKHTVDDYHCTHDGRYTPPPRWAKPSGPSPGHACGGGDRSPSDGEEHPSPALEPLQ